MQQVTSDDSKDSICEELGELFNHFTKYHIKFFEDNLIKNWVERIFSNRQLGTRVYIRIILIMVLE
jgi:hypothetical protein